MVFAARVASAAPSKAEVDQFATQMGASLDEVLANENKAEAAEKAGKLDEAERFWGGVWQGAAMLRQHALRAAAGGMFQDPMKFPTKVGKLTAKQYLARAKALSAKGDARMAKAQVALGSAANAKAKRTYVDGTAANVASLVKLLDKAKREPTSHAIATRIALTNVERSAQAIATSVKSAEAQGRAAKGATYPTKPKPLAAAALVTYLGTVARDAKAARVELDKKAPPPKAKTVAKATTTAKPTRPSSGPANTSAASEPEAPAEPAAPVCQAGNINCDTSGEPCCEGERCLAAGYIVYSDHFEADYYMCQDPDLATAPPTM